MAHQRRSGNSNYYRNPHDSVNSITNAEVFALAGNWADNLWERKKTYYRGVSNDPTEALLVPRSTTKLNKSRNDFGTDEDKRYARSSQIPKGNILITSHDDCEKES